VQEPLRSCPFSFGFRLGGLFHGLCLHLRRFPVLFLLLEANGSLLSALHNTQLKLAQQSSTKTGI